MATRNHNLSKFDAPLPSAADMRFGIVVAEWNREVTEALLEGAVRTLRAAGCSDLNIQIKYVPGTFELALGAQFFAEYTDVDGVVIVMPQEKLFALQALLGGIVHLQMQWNMPVAIGGADKAVDIVRMIILQTDMEASAPDNQAERHVVN